MYNIDEYTALIKSRLSDYRFYHSLCVAQSAVELARRYGADEEKARVAGLLHDVMKEADADEQLEIIRSAGYNITELEMSQTKFYHQISGAAFVKSQLHIDDAEILNAIRYHTTGRGNMSIMEQIIYLADFISADREYKDIENIRAEARKSKEQGMLYATGYTIKSVVKKGRVLHPDTVDAYNWLLTAFFKNKVKDE